MVLRQHVEGLEHHRQHNQSQAQIKTEVQVLGFLENNHGPDDAVYRLKVVAQVDRKGGNDFQYLNLEDIESDGTYRRQTEQVNEILRPGQNGVHGEIMEVERQDARQAQETAQHLVHQHGAGGIVHGHFLVDNGKQRSQGRRDDAHADTGPVAGVEMENQHDASHGHQAEQNLPQGNAVTVDEGLKDGGKDAHQRQADHTDGHVGGLDASIEENPVAGQQQPHGGNLCHIAKGDFPQLLQARKQQKEHHGGKHHPVPYEQSFVQGNQSPEHARPSGNENGKMQFYKCFLHNDRI